MSYAQRPMGDYRTYGYAGDPGWLSSIWKGIKKIAPTIIGGMIGGPMGAIVAGGATAGQPRLPAPPGTIGGAVTFPGGVGISGAYMPMGTGRSLAPVGRQLPGKFPRGVEYAGGACPTGYHLAKDGSGRMVRNRRMNIANPRALRRAMRRVQGFEKLAKRTITFTKRTRLKKSS